MTKINALCLTIAAAILALAGTHAAQGEQTDMRPVIVFDGDSLTQGTADAPPRASDQIATLARGWWSISNVGQGGQTLLTMRSSAGDVDALYRAGAYRNVVIAWGGTNDIHYGATAADVLTRYQGYAADRHAAGWTVIVITVLPRSYPGTSPTFEARRQEVNAAIRATWPAWADGLVDVAADARIGDYGDEVALTWYTDRAHPSTAGHAVIADAIMPTLLALAGDVPMVAPTQAPTATATATRTPTPAAPATEETMALTDNLMGAWRFDSALTDSSGRGNDLTGSGSPGYAAGKLGNALSLTGTEYAYRADNADLSVAGPFTIVSWINVTGTNFSFIATKHGAAGNREWDFRLQNNAGVPGTSRNLEIFVSNNGTALTGAASTGTLVTPSTWHMVAGGYDGSLVWVQVDNGTVFSTAYSSGVFDSTSEFRIGSRADTSSFKMIGLQDMTMLWDRALTAGELTTLYNSGTGHDPTASVSGPAQLHATMHRKMGRR